MIEDKIMEIAKILCEIDGEDPEELISGTFAYEHDGHYVEVFDDCELINGDLVKKPMIKKWRIYYNDADRVWGVVNET